jgi:hypothetical protein
MKRKSKNKKDNANQLKELIIIQTAMFYLTLFLEQAGVIKNNQFIKGAEKDFADIKGAISLGKQVMFVLSRVKMDLQQKSLSKANSILKETENITEFNYLVFVLILLMEYKENFKNNVYHLPIKYEELNALFDEYFMLGLKDDEQMQVIKDSTKAANEYYRAVVEYGNKN